MLAKKHDDVVRNATCFRGRHVGHPQRRIIATLARDTGFTEGKCVKVTGMRGRMEPGCKKNRFMGSGLQE